MMHESSIYQKNCSQTFLTSLLLLCTSINVKNVDADLDIFYVYRDFFKISVTIYMFNKLICLLKQCKKEKICIVLLFFVFACFLDKTWETKAKLKRV